MESFAERTAASVPRIALMSVSAWAFAGFANRRSELPLSIDAVPLPQTAGPRKVASPDPAETPAPVRMTIEGVAVAARLTKMTRREKAAAPSRLSRS